MLVIWVVGKDLQNISTTDILTPYKIVPNTKICRSKYMMIMAIQMYLSAVLAVLSETYSLIAATVPCQAAMIVKMLIEVNTYLS